MHATVNVYNLKQFAWSPFSTASQYAHRDNSSMRETQTPQSSDTQLLWGDPDVLPGHRRITIHPSSFGSSQAFYQLDVP